VGSGAEYPVARRKVSSSFGFLNNNVGVGALASSNYVDPTSYDSIGLLIDTSNAFLLPVAIPYTNIAPF
jgi:hypothetical protein